MTSPDGRKRGRSLDSDCDECLPISKRINRLQIKSACTSQGENETKERHGNNRDLCMTYAPLQERNVLNSMAPLPIQQQCIPQNAVVQHTSTSQHLCDGGTSGCHQCGLCRVSFSTDGTALQCPDLNANEMDSRGLRFEDLAGYDPELTETENPHYYSINQLLYDAHVERVERHGVIFKNT
ncbi:hypothetical protein CHS0354_005686 [Potamilus streckersoni]|uniref:Uncharacterized protein n=1 Tax=Potamilus streckersoni TaxID=2493646 RepID=A0AAE0S3W4_9BIVA|nr:hypothetical protein CHS0354_005686 [Potamilus streckersoni]